MWQSVSFPPGVQTWIACLKSKRLHEATNTIKRVGNLKAVQTMPWEPNVIHVNLMEYLKKQKQNAGTSIK